jgi:predicted DNA-binding transcriptional regulator AlpA
MSEPSANTVQWLTPEDLGRMWQVSVGTIANWRTNKKGPEFVRIGGLVRYSPEAVNAWLAKQPTK